MDQGSYGASRNTGQIVLVGPKAFSQSVTAVQVSKHRCSTTFPRYVFRRKIDWRLPVLTGANSGTVSPRISGDEIADVITTVGLATNRVDFADPTKKARDEGGRDEDCRL